MAPKRNMQEAFGKANGSAQLSAFAAARLAKQDKANPATEPVPSPLVSPSLPPLSQGEQGEQAVQAEQDLRHRPSTPFLDLDRIVAAASKRNASHALLSTAPTVCETNHDVRDISLSAGEHVTCVGEYDVQVVSGAVSVYGALLGPAAGSHRIYAPSTQALPQIVGRRDGTVIRLSHGRSSIRQLEKLSPLFRNVWAKDSGVPQRSFTVLRTAADDELQRALVPLEIDRTGQAALSRLAMEAETRSVRVMAIGAKSSGKSTFNRLLCNTLLSKPSVGAVYYLDLDPGQPEFGPPGQLSLVEVTTCLFGPPFTHPASTQSQHYRLLRSHTVAATTFKDDPAHYIACARDLAQHANKRSPIIVNACGWITGIGANVIADLTPLASITDLVVLDPVEESLLEWLRAGSSTMTCHRLPRQPSRPNPRTPAESRAMQTMAHFHSTGDSLGRSWKWTDKPVSALRPWILSYAAPEAGLLAIHSYGESVNPKFLSEILDGSIVAIATVDEHEYARAFNTDHYASRPVLPSVPLPSGLSVAHSADHLINTTSEGLPYIEPDCQGVCHPMNPKHSQCAGLALVRAIDVERKELHLITPISGMQFAALMERRVVLVRGSFDSPEWAYCEDLYRNGDINGSVHDERPWVSRRGPVGVEGAVWRLRHPPMASALGIRQT